MKSSNDDLLPAQKGLLFQEMISHYPFMTQYLDPVTSRLNGDQLHAHYDRFCRDEKIVAVVLIRIWRGMDVVHQKSIVNLEYCWRQPILEWMGNPYWPLSGEKVPAKRRVSFSTKRKPAPVTQC